jgi:hypothetical protein
MLQDEFEDTTGAIRIRISKNSQKKKYKRTNNDLQNTHIKPKIEQHEPHQKPEVNSGAPEGLAVPAPLVTPIVQI